MNINPIIFNMYQMAFENNHRVFMFLSSRPQEGTTYCVKRVANELYNYFPKADIAVVDLNIHNPDLSLPIKPKKRASKLIDHGETYLRELDKKPVTIENQSKGLPGVFDVSRPSSSKARMVVVPLAKRIKPGELWQNNDQDFPGLLKSLTNHFNFVLVDCSPVIQYPEALFASRYMDGVYLVVETGKTRRPVVQESLNHLAQAGANVSGIIMNKRSFHIPKWIYRRVF